MKKSKPAKPSAKIPAPICVELNPYVPGGLADGQQERLIRGRVVSDLPIASVALIVRGETAARAGYALANGIASPGPGGSLGAGSVEFLFNLGFPDHGKGEGVAFEIQIERIGATTHREPYFLALDAGALAPGRITRGAVGDPAALAGMTAPVFLYIERAEIDPAGRLTVEGWAACVQGSVTVQILAGGRQIGEVLAAGDRPDIALAFPAYAAGGTLGFIGSGQIDARLGEPRFTATATAGDGRSHEIVAIARQKTAPAGEPAPLADNFLVHIDNPAVLDGSATVLSRLTIEGWAIGPSAVNSIDVLLGGQKIGSAHHGLVRQDVATALPAVAGALHSGFAFHCPPRALKPGIQPIELVVSTASGASKTLCFDVDIRSSGEIGPYATIRRHMQATEATIYREILAELGREVQFRLVLRLVGRMDLARLRTTLDSLRSQIFSSWRLHIVTDSRAGRATIAAEAAAAGVTDNINLVHPDHPELPASATTWVGMIAPGDVLGCDALMEAALQAGQHPAADFIYADDTRISPASGKREPFFKPDWSPDLLLSANYIGRLWFATSALLGRAGITDRDLAGAGIFDVVLRATEQANDIRHIQKLLGVAVAEPFDAAAAEQRALVGAAARRAIAGDILPGRAPTSWRLRRTVLAHGQISIIIPTCGAHGHIHTCIESLRSQTAYTNYEIVIIDNIPASRAAMKRYITGAADRILAIPGDFNWSSFNNAAAATCGGNYLLFLNDDVEIIEPGWLEAMLEHAQRNEIGVVGAQLLYPNRTVQHAGMFLAAPGVARHAFRFSAADEPGYFGLALTQRNVMAVTGACLLTRRETFEKLGGFDEGHAIVANDLDFCLRAHEVGLRTVYTPHATLLHHEQASRNGLADLFDADRFERRWKTLFASGDPYFSPRLNRQADDYQPDEEPVSSVFAGGGLFRRQDMHRILLMKLDHIGDFITAVPAIRQLRQLFPAARLSVLAAPAAHHFLPADIGIENFIGFEFFNARSDLGRMAVGEPELQALRESLGAQRFDLAIDLRKHPDTRDVLKYTGATLLAGFESAGRFPFLDVALEWEADRPLQRKRSHVTDDLVALVDAVGRAVPPAASQETRRTAVTLSAPRFLPGKIRRLWQSPVIAIHPGSGSEMRMWPTAHFAALIELLLERNGVNVIVIGGADERPLAEAVLRDTAYRDRAMSVAGLAGLDTLPALLASCAMFIGNNSGPKHIAASLGVPTIGVHAANVDPIEWAPVGRRAVAIWRDMTCSPCYLSRAGDCPRGVACITQLDPTLVHQMAALFLARPN